MELGSCDGLLRRECGRHRGSATARRGRRRSAAGPRRARRRRGRAHQREPLPRADEPIVPTGLRRPIAAPPPASGRRAGPGRCGCARCRDAACARRPPGRHSSPCRNRRRRAVHVGLVREGIAIDEIAPAARYAERDAMRLIGGGVDRSAPIRSASFCSSSSGSDRGRRAPHCADRQRQVRLPSAGSPSQAASTPRSSDRSSTSTLARSL